VRSSLFRGFASMYVWQGANYLLPLITLPYLARVLTPAGYGTLGFAGGVVAYLVLLTGWGFGLSATQQIAAGRDDPALVNAVFWNTIAAKALLAVASLAILALAVFAIPDLRRHALVLFLAWLQVPGGVITADWFLQGMELMPLLATVGIASRAIPIPFFFLLVHSPADLPAAAALQSVGAIAGGCLSLRIALRTGRIGRPQVSLHSILRQIRGGAELFLSNAALSLYVNLNTVVLASVSGTFQTGLFVGADKIRYAVLGLISPISTVMYPRLSGMFATERGRMIVMIRRLLLLQGGFTAVLSIGTFITAPLAVRLLLGPSYLAAIPVLRALSPVPFLVGINNVLGIQIMLPFGWRRDFLLMIAVPGVLSLTYMPYLAWRFGAVGVGAALSVTELLVNVVAGVLLWRRRAELLEHRHDPGCVPAL
jgi:PST family polysaccharide transporter